MLLTMLVYVRLDEFGVDSDLLPLYYLYPVFTSFVLVLHWKKRITLAHIFGTLCLISVGWTGALIFGKTFNGYQIFFIAILYSVIAFSKSGVWMRASMTALSFLSLPIVDYLSHQKVIPLTGFDSADFPFSLLVSDTITISGFIILLVWVEKSMANNHEKLLEEALLVIRHQKGKMDSMLDNIQLGIIMVDSDLKIDGEYSKYVESVFETSQIEDEDLIHFLLSSAELTLEEMTTNRLTLENTLGESAINWELNKEHMIKEVQVRIQGQLKDLKLAWTPVIHDDVLEKVIVSIDDVTEEKRVAAKLQQQKNIESRFKEIMGSMRKIGLNRTLVFLEKLSKSKGKMLLGVSREKVLQDMHGLKGEARTLGFAKLSHIIHETEEGFLSAPDASIDVVIEKSGFARECKELNLAKESLFQGIATEGEWVLAEPLALIKKNLQETSSVAIGRLVIDDQITHWPPGLRDDLTVVLTHAIQNSIDHGYIKHHLKRDVELKVLAYQMLDSIYLKVKDYGFGLDSNKLEAIFRELPAEMRAEIARPENVIFLDQVSTAGQVTETSGRGIGMAAVKSLVQQHGGIVEIKNNTETPGTELTIILPAQVLEAQQAA